MLTENNFNSKYNVPLKNIYGFFGRAPITLPLGHQFLCTKKYSFSVDAIFIKCTKLWSFYL